MKKALFKSIMMIVAIGALFWLVSVLKCEILTVQHSEEFEGLDETTNIVSKADNLKVLKYSNRSASVYYYDEKGGIILSFEKKNDEWVFHKWEKTVWSKSGSADGLIWPYIR